MNKVEALTDLLEKVKNGAANHGCFAKVFINDDPSDDGCIDRAIKAHHSYIGSLDAAEALHEAVLPGWTWNVAQAQGYAWAMIYGHVGLHIERIEAQAGTPAIAWLTTIINALIVKETSNSPVGEREHNAK